MSGSGTDKDKGKKRRKRLKILLWCLKAAVGIGLVGFMFFSGRLDFGTVEESFFKGYWYVLGGLGLMAAVPFVGAVRWWLLLRAGEMAVPFRQVLRLTWIGAFFNTFLPGATGGDIVRVYGAASAFPDKGPEAVLSVVADRLTGLLSLAALAVVAVALNYEVIFGTAFIRETVLLMGGIWAGLSAVVLLLASRRTERLIRRLVRGREGAVVRAVARMDRAVGYFRGRSGTMAVCMVLSLAAYLCAIGAVFLAAEAVGERTLGFWKFLFMVPVIKAVNGIPASPGGVGQGEGFAEAVFRALGSSLGAETFLVFRVMMTLAWMGGLVPYLTGDIRLSAAEEVDRELEERAGVLEPEEAFPEGGGSDA